jgi:hypothetical protein
MAAVTTRNPDNGIITTTFSETFDAGELTAELGDYFDSCPRGAHLFIVTDFTALAEDPEPQNFIDTLIELCGRCIKVPVLVAAVAKGTMGYAPGQIIHPYASKTGMKLQVFKSEDAATAWLLGGLD